MLFKYWRLWGKPKKMLNKFQKKAAIGETITWIVATLIIIAILIASIFITSLVAKTKSVDRSFSSGGSEDLMVTKSLSAFLLTRDSSGENVLTQLQRKADSDDVQGIFETLSGELAEDIFLKLYRTGYAGKIWLGVYLMGYGARRNSYFETPPVDFVVESGQLLIKVKDWSTISPIALETIKLEEERLFVIVLTN